MAGLLIASMSASFAQKSDNHNFEISKNLEIFNDIYKQLDLYYVDTLSADTVIGWAIDGMLRRVDPFTEYYPEDNMNELREMTTGKYAGVGAVVAVAGVSIELRVGLALLGHVVIDTAFAAQHIEEVG